MDSEDVTVRPGDSGTEMRPGAEEPPEAEQGGPDSPDGPAPNEPTPDLRSVSAARQVDGARAWEASDRLARLALLLTGSPERAYRLTRRTLISVGRTGPYVQARRRLVRRAVRTRVDSYAAGLLPGLDGPAPAARLWRRLMGLPTAERALLVLTEAEGMADPVAGAVLGLPRAGTEQTLSRVRGVVEAQAQLTEAERREVLAGPALRSASGVVPVQALSRALRTRRVRRALVALAAVLVVGGASVAVATAAPGEHPGTDPALRTRASAKLADPARWRARGDLLTDHGLLRAAVRVWLATGYHGEAVGSDQPVAVWAGRLTGGRSLVVLAGQDPAGHRVLGALLDRGHGPTLVRAVPSVSTLAVDLGNLTGDPPDSRRYLVAPWVAAMTVNDVDGRQPTGAQQFVTVGLHDGLSEPWAHRTGTEHCTRPLLHLAQSDTVDGADTADTDDTTGYTLDVAGPGPTATVAGPPEPAPARDAYFTALHGLLACVGPGGFHRSLVGGTSAARGIVTDLAVAAVSTGKLPDGGTGQVLRWSWRVIRPPVDDARSGPAPGGDVGQAFALVTGGAATFSTVRFAAGPQDGAVDGVVWMSARNRRGYVLLAGGPGVARVDLAPRPKGFRPGHPVAFLGLPKRGQRLSVVGLDSTGRPISVQPLNF